MKNIMFLAMIILIGVFVMACDNPYKDYEELRLAGQELMKQQKYEEAISLFEKYESCFPDKVYNITYNIAMLNLQLEHADKAIIAIKRGVDRGAIFPLFKGFGIYEMIKDEKGAEELYATNEQARIAETERTKPWYTYQKALVEVMNPPLLIALHGGGENAGIFYQRWNSEKLKVNYNTLYVQSSDVFATGRYWWDNLELGIRNIDAMLDSSGLLGISNKYGITIGGFSHGGRMALYYFLKSPLNINKVIMLCPEIDLDEFYSDEMADKIKKSSVEIILITGTEDQSIEQQRRFKDFLTDKGIEMNYIELEGMGHMFSDDFYKAFDEVI